MLQRAHQEDGVNSLTLSHHAGRPQTPLWGAKFSSSLCFIFLFSKPAEKRGVGWIVWGFSPSPPCSLLILTPDLTDLQAQLHGLVLAPTCPYFSSLRFIFLFFFFLLRLQGNCQDLFHACPLAAGSTLTMGGHTAEGGRRARRTATGSVQDPRARASTAGPGRMASSCWVSTLGLVGTPTKAPGLRARDMAWVSRIKADGCTKASGRTALRDATACGRAQGRAGSTRGRGTTGSRTDTEQRRTQMEVREGGETQGQMHCGCFSGRFERVTWECVNCVPVMERYLRVTDNCSV